MANPIVSTNSAPMIALGGIFGTKVVRVTPPIDGEPRLSVRDIIAAICEKNKQDAADAWQDLSPAYKAELTDSLREFQFRGRGERKGPVVALGGAVKLAMFLPGQMAAGNRAKFSQIITRHITGDPTLAAETAHNANIGVAAACAEMLSEATAEASAAGVKRMREVSLSYHHCNPLHST